MTPAEHITAIRVALGHAIQEHKDGLLMATVRHELCDAIYHLTALESLSGGWQPIETAPRDGEVILACNSGKAQRGMVFFNSLGEWELINGLTNYPMGIGFYPTHWMPLPTAPIEFGTANVTRKGV